MIAPSHGNCRVRSCQTMASTARHDKGWPVSIRRLTSYNPAAAKGAISGKPRLVASVHVTCPAPNDSIPNPPST